MAEIGRNTPFKELLDYCSDPDSEYWELAWKEFLRRYKNYLYKAILRRCLKFHHSRIRKQLSDIVNDIFSEVVYNLYKNDCRALKQYRARENEKVFLSFLTVICNITTLSHLKKIAVLPVLDEKPEFIQTFFQSVEKDMKWHIYEDCVTVLRQEGTGAPNAERDIAIFNLYVIAGFTTAMILSLPSYSDVGDRVVDNVVYRARQCLKRNSSWYDFL